MTRSEARARTVAMYRVRNESARIAASLERTWRVAKTVVVFDDGSGDETAYLAALALGMRAGYARTLALAAVATHMTWRGDAEDRTLYLLRSPFRTASVRDAFAVNEVRDKNYLWEYVKSQIEFDYVLCLDGDEVLSQQAVREWPRIIAALEYEVDQLALSFVYLWDREDQRRCDAPLYAPLSAGGAAAWLRAFTVKRMAPLSLFKSRFEYFCGKCHFELATSKRKALDPCTHPGAGQAGFHCGSIPTVDFRVARREVGPSSNLAWAGAPALGRMDLDDLIIHYGYLDAAQRERKYQWYNELDPDNEYEGRYEHIRGRANQWAPEGVKLAPWEDL